MFFPALTFSSAICYHMRKFGGIIIMKRKDSPCLLLAANTFSHAVVDFCCFTLLYTWMVREGPAAAAPGFLLYNVLAFGLQPLLGFLQDRMPRLPLSGIGCLLTAAGLLMGGLPWAGMPVCALGNACFHVGGGRETLRLSAGRQWPAGVFVSSGAPGVALGILAGKLGFPLWGAALLAAACIPALRLCRVQSPLPAAAFRTAAARPVALVAGLCFLSVALRSFGGSLLSMPWKTGPWLSLLPAVCACLGKAAGGFAADRWGGRRTGVLSLLAAAPLLAFGNVSPLFCGAGLFLFNMTMAITLCALASAMPEHPGFAFGLSTLALLLGNLPYFFAEIPFLPWLMLLSTLLSAACILYSVGGKDHVQPAAPCSGCC